MVKDMENQNVTSNLAHVSMASRSAFSGGGASVSAKISNVSAAPTAPKYVGGAAVFVTPKGTVDPQSLVYVLQLRNSETGEVKDQYPSKKVVSEYKSTPVVEAPSEGRGQATAVAVQGAEQQTPASTRGSKQDVVA